MTADRSAKVDTRNPVLGLPSAQALADLPPEAREALRLVLLDIRQDAQQRAEKAWRSHKGPMAAYWRAVGVYAGHIARATRAPATPAPVPTRCPVAHYSTQACPNPACWAKVAS